MEPRIVLLVLRPTAVDVARTPSAPRATLVGSAVLGSLFGSGPTRLAALVLPGAGSSCVARCVAARIQRRCAQTRHSCNNECLGNFSPRDPIGGTHNTRPRRRHRHAYALGPQTCCCVGRVHGRCFSRFLRGCNCLCDRFRCASNRIDPCILLRACFALDGRRLRHRSPAASWRLASAACVTTPPGAAAVTHCTPPVTGSGGLARLAVGPRVVAVARLPDTQPPLLPCTD
jgi:hypothetical protein